MALKKGKIQSKKGDCSQNKYNLSWLFFEANLYVTIFATS